VSKYVVDARHMMCPLPVIRTQQKIDTLDNGDELLVLATDPGTLHDVPAWCRVHGHVVLGHEQAGEELRIKIRISR